MRDSLDRLDRAQASVRTLLELSTELAVVHRQGRIVFVNPALVRGPRVGLERGARGDADRRPL